LRKGAEKCHDPTNDGVDFALQFCFPMLKVGESQASEAESRRLLVAVFRTDDGDDGK
jgi:hypothetical protein